MKPSDILEGDRQVAVCPLTGPLPEGTVAFDNEDINEMSITLYTDGSCINNGSPFARGGWAAVLEGSGKQLRISGHQSPTTNNRMELMAILEGLKAIRAESAVVTLYTDSAYARNGCKTWRHDWKRRGWRTAQKKPVENQDLWQQIDELLERHRVDLKWVKGHNGHPQNELADRLAHAAALGKEVSEYRQAGDYGLEPVGGQGAAA